MNPLRAQSDLDTDLRFGPPGSARVTLRGRLNVQTTVPCWDRLEHGLRTAKLEKLDVDASGLRVCDGAGFALLRYLNMGRMTPGASVSVNGLEPGLEQIFRGFTAQDYEALRPPARLKCHPLPEEVGCAVSQAASDLRDKSADPWVHRFFNRQLDAAASGLHL